MGFQGVSSGLRIIIDAQETCSDSAAVALDVRVALNKVKKSDDKQK